MTPPFTGRSLSAARKSWESSTPFWIRHWKAAEILEPMGIGLWVGKCRDELGEL